MTTTTIDLTNPRFDVRDIPCRIKHGLIFERWHALGVGEHFVLINDHDPVPLYYQFSAEFPHAFRWDYEQRGPDLYAVRITRTAATPQREASTVQPPVAPPNPPEATAATVTDKLIEVDARGLEPPEPMMRILNAVELLPTGGRIKALTDRRPLHLLPELEKRGLRHNGKEQPDGSWLTTIDKA